MSCDVIFLEKDFSDNAKLETDLFDTESSRLDNRSPKSCLIGLIEGFSSDQSISQPSQSSADALNTTDGEIGDSSQQPCLSNSNQPVHQMTTRSQAGVHRSNLRYTYTFSVDIEHTTEHQDCKSIVRVEPGYA